MEGKPSRKIPMEKRKTQAELQVTFCKRRQGLFSKASQICCHCDAKVAVLVRCPEKLKDPDAVAVADENSGSDDDDDGKPHKFYSFGHPSVDSVLAELNGKNRNNSGRYTKLGKDEVRRMAELTGKKPAKENSGLFSNPVVQFSKQMDELANGGGDLNKLVELLKNTKNRAESKLRCRGRIIPQPESPAVVVAGSSGSNNNDISSSSNTASFPSSVPRSCSSDTPIWSRFDGCEGTFC